MIEATKIPKGAALAWARRMVPVFLLVCLSAGAQERESGRTAPRTLSIEREEQERRERELQMLERLLEAEREAEQAEVRRRAAPRVKATPSSEPGEAPAPKPTPPAEPAAAAATRPAPKDVKPKTGAAVQQAESAECRLHVSELSSGGTLTYASVTQMPGARRLPGGAVYTPPVRLADGREVVFEVSPDGCARLARGVR